MQFYLKATFSIILNHKKCIIVFKAHLSSSALSTGHIRCGWSGGPSGRGRVRPGWGGGDRRQEREPSPESVSGEWSTGPRPVTARPVSPLLQCSNGHQQVARGPQQATLLAHWLSSVHRKWTSFHCASVVFKNCCEYEAAASDAQREILQYVPVDNGCIGQNNKFSYNL